MSNNTHARRRSNGLGRYAHPSQSKLGYGSNLEFTEDHQCTPSIPHLSQYPIFSSSTEFFQQYLSPIQQTDRVRYAGESPYSSSSSASSSHRTSQADLTNLSSRPYSVRVHDQADFASVWESTVVPLLTDLLQRYCDTDFAVDVHNFPEMSSEAVPRVIYVTLSASSVDPSFEQLIRNELSRAVPARFNPLYLKFRRGSVQKTNTGSRASWWGTKRGEKDLVCEPRNITYRSTPVIGISIGPVSVPDAASLGGFVKVGRNTYAMSALHAFEDSIKSGHFRVSHPAEPDLSMITPSDPDAEPLDLGSVTMSSRAGTLRPSLTFRNTNFAPELTKVEMDWCLIGPVESGKNILSVPSFRADSCVAVQETGPVEGNTEVYALARTSGYSLGFVSDVPGLQRISGNLRREWTVRQYSPFKHPRDGRTSAPWQTLKQWVTSGIGVPGDSGAWLIRRSDNNLMGLIWGRNHDHGDPVTQVRLTYFTPIVDIIDDVRENHARGDNISLPVYATNDLIRVNQAVREPVEGDMSRDPWTILSSDAIERRRQAQRELVGGCFVDGNVPPSGAKILDVDQERPSEEVAQTFPRAAGNSRHHGQMDGSVMAAADRRTTPTRSEGGHGSISTLQSQDRLLLGVGQQDDSLPGLSNAPSIRSSFGSAPELSEINSLADSVRIVDEHNLDEDVEDVEEPIRTKASFGTMCNAIAFPPTKKKTGYPGRASWCSVYPQT